MTEQLTRLDVAHQKMEQSGQDADRAAFYERLAEAEVMLLLAAESDGAQVVPHVFEADGLSFVLIFDTEERLVDFVGQATPYAALSGRVVVQMLAGQGLGLGLNLGGAPSETLLDAAAVDWLAEQVQPEPSEAQDIPQEIAPPHVPEAIITALDGKLAGAAGLARSAYLVQVHYKSGAKGHMLAFIDAVHGAEGALSQAMTEALHFADIDAASLDVAFFDRSDSFTAHLAKHGLRFDIPQPAKEQSPSAPGMDPQKPPKLR
ncbi:SseB family protein [Algirhabdus cladophorae]|uniref:SseB family protein n=1 Tax=Algirhabdus cladophorae TaxID=3377108 RepID=UPI003B849E88